MSCGVAILVKNASYYNLIDTCEDDKGRLIVLTLTIDEVAIQLASVYAPVDPICVLSFLINYGTNYVHNISLSWEGTSIW